MEVTVEVPGTALFASLEPTGDLPSFHQAVAKEGLQSHVLFKKAYAPCATYRAVAVGANSAPQAAGDG